MVYGIRSGEGSFDDSIANALAYKAKLNSGTFYLFTINFCENLQRANLNLSGFLVEQIAAKNTLLIVTEQLHAKAFGSDGDQGKTFRTKQIFCMQTSF